MSGGEIPRRDGLAALERGDFAAAAAALMRAVQAEPGNAQNWLGLMLALARGGDVAMLAQVAGLWGNVRGDRFSALFDTFTMLMTYGLHDPVLALAAITAGPGPESLPGVYYLGCVHILREQHDEAFAAFARFQALAATHRDSLPIGPDHPFNVAYRQGTLVEDRAYVDRLMAAPPPAPPVLEPVLSHVAPTAPFVLMAACNGRYFDIFADAYVRSVDALTDGMLLHLHVVDPPADLAGRAARMRRDLRRTALNVTTQPPPPHATAAYYASVRFLIAGQLLDLYHRDLLITDIDFELVADPAPWHPRLAGLAFACYAHPGFGPASRLAAGVTHFSDRHGGRDMADVVARFVHSKLDVPWPHNWMLDQAALLSAERWLRHARPDLAFGRLDAVFGVPPEGLFITPDRDAEKQDALAAARG